MIFAQRCQLNNIKNLYRKFLFDIFSSMIYNLTGKNIEVCTMSNLATTRLSSKGQVVIPEEIRVQMKLHTGDQFLVVAEKGVMILKIIQKPDMSRYQVLIAKTRKLAKSSGLSEQDIVRAIKAVRKK